jgi:hypothetical protein
MNRFESLENKEFLELNSKLQKKKNGLRKKLAEKGIMKKDRKNTYDNYTYFSEAGYKELFTNLFSDNGLELTPTVKLNEIIEGTANMSFGRRVTIEFKLTDIETGFYETTEFIGEAFDRGDKAIYKAYTGALKYYFATAFNVATGDDVETESPDGGKIKNEPPKAEDLERLKEEMKKKGVFEKQILKTYHVEKMEDLKQQHLKAAFRTLEKMADIEQEVDINAI